MTRSLDDCPGRSISISLYDHSIDGACVTIVTVSPKFQVVIPKEIREALGLEPGQRVQVLAFENRIEFIPVRPMPAMRGVLQGIDTTIERDGDRV